MALPMQLSVEDTLFCGQCFAWKREGDSFLGVAGQNAARIAPGPDGNRLFWEGPADEAFWRHTFDLERDYDAIAQQYLADDAVYAAFLACPGLRVMNQPIWETLCAFILSANNNDARIRLCVDRLAKDLGEPCSIQGHALWRFPTPQAIMGAGEKRLRALGLGYRAPYLWDTAMRVAQGCEPLLDLPVIGYGAALERLMALKGVGRKVADCVLLFSCGYGEAFPVDVWVERTMQRLYGPFPGGKQAALRMGISRYGQHAGIVQQMLFHAARSGRLASPAARMGLLQQEKDA